MKLLLLSLIALSVAGCVAYTPVEIENGKALGIMPIQHGHISYQGTHSVDASREDIFRQVRRWAAFRSTRSIFLSPTTLLKIPAPATAFSISDNLLGDVIATGTIEGEFMNPRTTLRWPSVTYSVSVEAYEGYYRLTLTNFYTYGLPSAHYMDLRDKSTSLKTTRAFYKSVDEQVSRIVEELNRFVKDELATLPSSSTR